MKRLRWVLILFFLIVIFYFSWIPDSDLLHTGFFPKEWKYWIDDLKNFRTIYPFIGLGYFGQSAFKKLGKLEAFVGVILLSLMIVSLAELGQLLLPERHFDWADIMYGFLGASLGACLLLISQPIFYRIQNQVYKIKRARGQPKNYEIP